jgi:hypothetical protein
MGLFIKSVIRKNQGRARVLARQCLAAYSAHVKELADGQLYEQARTLQQAFGHRGLDDPTIPLLQMPHP